MYIIKDTNVSVGMWWFYLSKVCLVGFRSLNQVDQITLLTWTLRNSRWGVMICGSSEVLVNRFWSYTYAGRCGNYGMIWSHICQWWSLKYSKKSNNIMFKPLYIVIKKPLPTRQVSSIRMKPYQGPYRYKAWSPALPIMKNANMVSTWQRLPIHEVHLEPSALLWKTWLKLRKLFIHLWSTPHPGFQSQMKVYKDSLLKI